MNTGGVAAGPAASGGLTAGEGFDEHGPSSMSVRATYSSIVLRIYRRIWLGRIDSATPAIPPRSIVFAAHYNGAVDGFTYGSQLPPARGVVSVQWHRHLIGRLLFPGITVQRAKDAGKGGSNLEAFREMVASVAAGERLLFFPEGTSRLGPARLPMGRGTLLLLKRIRALTPAPEVFFCAARYHAPTRWRSGVSVGWVGPVALPPSPADDEAWVTARLLEAQARAYAYPRPGAARLRWAAAVIGLPYLPMWWATAALARRTADDDNVIAIWKFLFGVPATALALLVYSLVAHATGVPAWAPAASLAGSWLLWAR